MARLSTTQNGEDAKHIPSGRWGYVKEIADATVYLFSDAGNYVNGEVLVVDGGAWHLGMQPGRGGFEYPDFLLTDEEVKGVKGAKKAKL
jgi:peroxisomal 2,4-dienoyl-CoA reductase